MVLILVLMEDTHRDVNHNENGDKFSLNPCSNGRYSQRPDMGIITHSEWFVLILVLMEDTHRV